MTAEEARRGRDEGIRRVEVGSAAWRAVAARALHNAAAYHETLTSDEVWRVLAAAGISGPREPRAMGPVMLAGVRAGIVERTDRYVVAEDPATPRNHGRPQRVYRSLRYGRPLLDVLPDRPIVPVVRPAPPRMPPERVRAWTCSRCGRPVEPLASLDPRFPVGRCPKHGRVPAVAA